MKDYKPDKEVLKAIEAYREINITPSMEVYEAATIAVSKMKDYFKNIDYTEDTVEKVQKAIINFPKMQEALNQAKDICLKEKSIGTKNRGGYKSSQFED